MLSCPYLKWLELRLFLARALLLGSVAVFPSEPCQEHYRLLIFFFFFKLLFLPQERLHFILRDLAELEFHLALLFPCWWGMYECSVFMVGLLA